jgi:lysophospholipase L1-like esterase
MDAPRNYSPALTAAMIGLAPLLLCQGIYVRRTTPKLPEAEGLRSGEAGSGPPLRLLVIGDSAAAGVGAGRQEDALVGRILAGLVKNFRVQWALHARTGETTRGATRRLAHITEKRPADGTRTIVVVSLGVNDVTSGCSIGKWIGDLEKLSALLRDGFGATEIMFSGLPPMHRFPALPQPLRWYLGARARLFDEALRAWAESRPCCEYLQPLDGEYRGMMATDGFHPGPAMYALWGAEAARRISARTLGTAQRA